MIAQYAAAALVSENKVLAHPASVDSIPSSANQEDHVSMGTIAARKAKEMLFNLSRVVAIELFAAAQGLDLNSRERGTKMGKGTEIAYKKVRGVVSKVTDDRVMYPEFEKVAKIIQDHSIVEEVEKVIGELKLN